MNMPDLRSGRRLRVLRLRCLDGGAIGLDREPDGADKGQRNEQNEQHAGTGIALSGAEGGYDLSHGNSICIAPALKGRECRRPMRPTPIGSRAGRRALFDSMANA